MNDNEQNVPEEFAQASKMITSMNDKERLGLLLSLIESGVEINTAFIKDDDSDIFTHQIIKISCGDYATLSQPEPLATPLAPASGAQLNQTVN